MKNKIYDLFLNKKLEIIFLIIIIAFGAYLRLENLSLLSFWYDEGQVYLGVEGIIKHGIPRLPSGNILYHTIFSFYLRVIPALVFGLNEFSLRIISAVFGIFTILLVYIFTREFLNKTSAIIATVVIGVNQWQIYLSRDARYFSEFQFFFLLSTYFFLKGFIKYERSLKYKIFFIISFLATCLINNAGSMLILLFIPLLIIKKIKFFRKEILIFFISALSLIIFQIIHRELYWKTGLTFFGENIFSNIIDIKKYIKYPSIYYFKVYKDTFPLMFYITVSGYLLLLINLSLNKFSFLKNTKVFKYRNSESSKKPPIYLLFILFILWSNIFVLSITNIPNEIRYSNFLFPFFIIFYSFTVCNIVNLVTAPIFQLKNLKNKINLKKSIKISIIILIFILTTNYANLFSSLKIPYLQDGDKIEQKINFSQDTNIRFAIKDSANYIKQHLSTNDIVISTDLFSTYPYTQKIDYWCWGRDMELWKPYEAKEGIFYDNYFGNTVIMSKDQLVDIININNDKNIWILATPFVISRQGESKKIFDYLTTIHSYSVFKGKDMITQVYFIPKGK
jgi:4-amino-4-deoxy-L-arabinose transferase-like glycosyltransferase